MISRSLVLALLSGLGLGLFFTPSSTLGADGAGLALHAQLIWGTDSDKPEDQSLKAIPSDLDKRLRRIFKWKNYFEVNGTNFVVAPAKPSRIDMSRECRIEVAQQPGGEVEIQLFGKGKLVVKKRQRVLPGETVVIAGDDKDYNAWFVVLAQQRPGAATP